MRVFMSGSGSEEERGGGGRELEFRITLGLPGGGES